MISLLSYVLWDVSPIMLAFAGLEVRWYGLLFAMAFVATQPIIAHIFKSEGKPEKDVDTLTLYMLVATIVGARLGHCLFYEPAYYLTHPFEILKVWKGGLASHGATIGIILAMYFYSRNRPGQSFLWILDRIVIVVALGGAFIRLGNLMNSEIVGKPTDVPWAFLFVNPAHQGIDEALQGKHTGIHFSQVGRDTLVDGGQDRFALVNCTVGFENETPAQMQAIAGGMLPYMLKNYDEAHEHVRPEHSPINPRVSGKEVTITLAAVPRHPAQLYESLSCIVLFTFLFLLWRRMKQRTPEGLFFSLFVIILFSLRFFYEFLKENQVEFENDLSLNMGQNLSIPLVLMGIVLLVWVLRRGPKREEVKMKN